MTDREKLIALIGEIQTAGLDYSNISAVCKTSNETLADHLIANGVVVREKGEWLQHTNASVECPVCGGVSAMRSDFCPNCGADMRKEEVKKC